MDPLEYDLDVYQGSDYGRSIPVLAGAQAQTVTGWTVSGQVRRGADSPEVLHTLDLTCVGTDVVLRIPGSVSATWPWRRGLYDVLLVAPDGGQTVLLVGAVKVRAMVTR